MDPFTTLTSAAGLLDVLLRIGPYLRDVKDLTGTTEGDIGVLRKDIDFLVVVVKSINALGTAMRDRGGSGGPTNTTTETGSSQYVMQHIPDRYIRPRVLDDYISARLDEFGNQWTRETIRDHHCITVLRHLAPDEMIHLQRTSYPGYFTSTYWSEDEETTPKSTAKQSRSIPKEHPSTAKELWDKVEKNSEGCKGILDRMEEKLPSLLHAPTISEIPIIKKDRIKSTLREDSDEPDLAKIHASLEKYHLVLQTLLVALKLLYTQSSHAAGHNSIDDLESKFIFHLTSPRSKTSYNDDADVQDSIFVAAQVASSLIPVEQQNRKDDASTELTADLSPDILTESSKANSDSDSNNHPMAEGLGVAASMAGLTAIADGIVRKGFRFIKYVKDAGELGKRLVVEVNNLSGILHSLTSVVEGLKEEELNFEQSALVHCIESCYISLAKVQRHFDEALPVAHKPGFERIRWSLKKSHTIGLLLEIDRHKETMILARSLIEMSAMLDILPRQDIINEDVQDIIITLDVARAVQEKAIISEGRRHMLTVLGSIDARRWQDSIIRLRQTGTCLWFLDGCEFTDWLSGSASKLWIYGIPGAGKTLLVSSIIQEIEKTVECSHGLAFFYCDYKDPRTHDPLNIFGALARQLILQDERCFAQLADFCEEHADEGAFRSHTPQELCDLIRKLSKYFQTTMIVVDGLDEIPNRAGITRLLRSLNTESYSIKTLFASRREIDIANQFGDFVEVSIAATSSDVRLYVAAEIDRRMRDKNLIIRDPNFKDDVMEALLNGAEGMFRWVACQMDYLFELSTDRDRREALEQLPRTLAGSYERVLERVNGSSRETQELVKNTLQFIVHAGGSSSTEQLLHALVVRNDGEKLFGPTSMITEEDILHWCSSLLRKNSYSKNLELTHSTVKEYLLSIDPARKSSMQQYSLAGIEPNIQKHGYISDNEDWDTDSVFSVAASTLSSKTSHHDDVGNLAVSELVNLLLADEELKILFMEAIQNGKVGPERFERNLRRLLNQYSVDLKKEAEEGNEKTAVYLVRSRSRFIANDIRRTLTGFSDVSQYDMLKVQSHDTAGILRRIEDLLKDSGTAQEKSLLEDEESLSNSDDEAPDDGITESQAYDKLPRLTVVKQFMLSSVAFAKFRENLRQFVHQDFNFKLRQLIDGLSKPGQRDLFSSSSIADLKRLLDDLHFVTSDQIRILQGENLGFSNRLKAAIEDATGDTWDWWPLKPRQLSIPFNQARLYWACSCGEERYKDIPASFADRLDPILQHSKTTITNAASEAHELVTKYIRQSNTGQNSAQSTSSDFNESSLLSSSPGSPAPATGSASASNIIAPGRHTSYVIFGVSSGEDIRLAQIEIQNHRDEAFFKELRNRYRELRGVFRRLFSIWRYAHCDFVKFEKIGDEEIVPRDSSMPSPENVGYIYKPKPVEDMPPVSKHEFRKRFYACHNHCLISKLHFLRHLHKCKRPCRHSHEALDRIPKKLLKVEEGGDQREMFWGICAVENISFVMVAVYHFLILLPPLIFWIMWLFAWGHSGDLQNASVPFLTALGLISLFWFPLIIK